MAESPDTLEVQAVMRHFVAQARAHGRP
jgi:hypothetical protein